MLTPACAGADPQPEKSETVPVTMEELDKNFRLMDLNGAEAEWQASVETLRTREGVVSALMALYADTGVNKAKGGMDPAAAARTQWRAVHLLGQLGNPEAVPELAAIAAKPLVEPDSVTETEFAGDYRLHLRAIAGLEALGAVDELEKLYAKGGVLKGAVAASLFELGRPPRGIKELDPMEVMGMGDPTDFHPKDELNKGGPTPQGPTRGDYDLDEANQPSVTPEER